MTFDPLILGACLVYGLGSNRWVEMGQGRRVSARTSVGSVLIALIALSYSPRQVAILAFVCGCAVSGGVKLYQGRLSRMFLTEVLGLAVSGLICVVLLEVGISRPPTGWMMVFLVLSVSFPFWILDWISGRSGARTGSYAFSALRNFLGVQLMLVSLAGMTMLTVKGLRWWSLALLVLVLAVVQSEFRKLAEAEVTYTQSVSALGRLIERAGYVRPGYHDAVEAILREVVERSGLKREVARRLSFGALAFSTGWVAKGDPEEISDLGRPELREAGLSALRTSSPDWSAAGDRGKHQLIVEIVPMVSDFVRYGDVLDEQGDGPPVESGEASSVRRFLHASLG